MEPTEVDLKNVCRTCKNKSPEMKSLYYRDLENNKEKPSLEDMLMACTSVQVYRCDCDKQYLKFRIEYQPTIL